MALWFDVSDLWTPGISGVGVSPDDFRDIGETPDYRGSVVRG